MKCEPPRVLLLDGDYPSSLSVARELSEDLDATIVGVGSSRYSRLLRSKYCDAGVVVQTTNGFSSATAILDVIEKYRPDVLLPIGYCSSAGILEIRSAIPESVSCPLPAGASFRIASDKVKTMECANRLGIETPTDHTALIEELDTADRPRSGLESIEFPVFLKACREVGPSGISACVDTRSQFWRKYDWVAERSPMGRVLVQEFVPGDGSTYGCGVLAIDNEIELVIGHEELRSVPRRGGSGTRLRIIRDERLEAASEQLLEEIGWHGVALVEFRRRTDGTFVLMEVNPKFWASYPLASRHGYRFASTMVADGLGLADDRPIGSPQTSGEMVFPLRELYYYMHNYRDERLFDCLTSVIRPDVTWSIDRTDLRAWLTPPPSLLEKLPAVDSNASDEPVGARPPQAERDPVEQK